MNKLVVLTGLFFSWNFSFSSPPVHSRSMPSIYFPFNMNSFEDIHRKNNIRQIVVDSEKYIDVSNISDPYIEKFYRIHKKRKKRLLKKSYRKIDSLTLYRRAYKDSDNRIIKMVYEDGYYKNIDSLAYDLQGRIKYYSHTSTYIGTEKDFRDYMYKYDELNYKINKINNTDYELISNLNEIIVINNQNMVLKKINKGLNSIDSLAYNYIGDTLSVTHFGKDIRDTLRFYMYNSKKYLKKRIIQKQSFYLIAIGKSTIHSNNINYIYDENNRLILMKNFKNGYLTSYSFNNYSENSNLVQSSYYYRNNYKSKMTKYEYQYYKHNFQSIDQIIYWYEYRSGKKK